MTNRINISCEDGRFGSRAAGIMIDGDKRVLLSRLEDDDIWVLPGGLIRLNETSQETVKREFFEETGFEIKVDRLLWIIENFFVFNDEKYHEVGFYFLVSPQARARNQKLKETSHRKKGILREKLGDISSFVEKSKISNRFFKLYGG